MSVGILLITHSGIGAALLNAAFGTFEHSPLAIMHLSVKRDPEPERLIFQASQLIRKIDSGHGVLILTDLFGSTPSNVAQALEQRHFNVHIITGLNLPMLLRILNYPHLNLKQLAEKAIEAGKAGIFAPSLEKTYDCEEIRNY